MSDDENIELQLQIEELNTDILERELKIESLKTKNVKL